MKGSLFMASFDLAVSLLLGHEGGYAAKDAGEAGSVNFGITERYVISIKRVTKDQAGEFIRTLTRDRAIQIYRAEFWDHYRLETINSQDLANVLFSMIVNIGPKAAVTTLQQSLGDLGVELEHDGIFGPVTRNTLNSQPPSKVAAVWRKRLADHYKTIAQKVGQGYLKGWMRRLDDLLETETKGEHT
jgi:lysozyme family protein